MTDEWTSVTNSKNASRTYSSFGSRGKTLPRHKNNSTRISISSINNGVNINRLKQDTHSSSKRNSDPSHNTYPPGFDEPISPSSSGTISPDISREMPTLPPYHIELSIKCPFVNCQPKVTIIDSTTLVDHLKDAHKLRISNLHHVYLILEEYLEFWAKEITKDGVLEQLSVEVDGEITIYVIDPEKLSKDRNIRDSLQRDKLNKILQIQANERDYDSKLERKCLFCKNICENRAVLFRHMFSEHNFNIGLPDNLANVDEFLQILEKKLTSLQCLYCEKIFTSSAVLRKHMRKKKHFKINAKNRIYDRFYVINYLEPGKNWETFEKERYDSDEEHHRDDSWDDWVEEESQPTNCLFCDTISPSSKDVKNHMKCTHGFDLLIIKRNLGLDFYQTIILINYIRSKTLNNTCMACDSTFDDNQHLIEHMNEENCFVEVPSLDNPLWKDLKHLYPTQPNDPLLDGFEDGEISDDNVNDDNDDVPLHNPDDTIVIPEEPPEELKEGIKQLMELNINNGSNVIDKDYVYNDVNI
ncbi:C2H2-type zinc finger transcription factor [Gigaspora margarita]|uniref:C2H2-type zinc finger transcription factor n=1 Tax=Gigaspora margarita TaxID=4874 RepID=A0A8H4AIQ8_GIGMA|nr:C2H2-type zinc finger transcription factor [Gigaspora margarita]